MVGRGGFWGGWFAFVPVCVTALQFPLNPPQECFIVFSDIGFYYASFVCINALNSPPPNPKAKLSDNLALELGSRADAQRTLHRFLGLFSC